MRVFVRLNDMQGAAILLVPHWHQGVADKPVTHPIFFIRLPTRFDAGRAFAHQKLFLFIEKKKGGYFNPHFIFDFIEHILEQFC